MAPDFDLLGPFLADLAFCGCLDNVLGEKEPVFLGEIAEKLGFMYKRTYFGNADDEEEKIVDLKKIVIPLIRTASPKKDLMVDGSVVEIGCTEKFYSSFERC